MVVVRGVTVVVRVVAAKVAGMVCSNSDQSYLFKLNVCRLISHHSSNDAFWTIFLSVNFNFCL